MNINVKTPRIFEPLFKGELKKYRCLVFYGGRGGGKTENICNFAILECLKNRDTNFYVARQYSISNRNSMLATFKRKIINLNLLDFVESKSMKEIAFKNNSKIIFLGVSKYTIDSIRGIDDASFFWLEESHHVDYEVVSILIPSVRNVDAAKKAQVIFTFNPKNGRDFVYKELVENGKKTPDYFFIQKVNFKDNPYFTEDLERDRKRDFEILPRDLYLNKWEGEPLDYNDSPLIDTEKIGYFDDTILKKEDYIEVILSLDTAFSTKSYADNSVIACFAKNKNDEVHLIHLIYGKWAFNDLLENLRNEYFFIKNYFKLQVEKILIEQKASGLSLIQELERLTNIPILGIIPTSDKVTRVVDCIIKNIDFLKIPLSKNYINTWVNDFLSELKHFRGDLRHESDDMVDATSQALKYFCRSENLDDTLQFLERFRWN